LFCVLCMFVWLRVQGFESSVNKVFQKAKLVHSKTDNKNIQTSIKEASSAGANLVQLCRQRHFLKINNSVCD
jgi:hypothetical protein